MMHAKVAQNVIINPAMNQIEDFDAIPNLEKFINFDPIESLRRMATADALIISHSSFSYLPAILNPDCIVIYHPYWRSRMKDWVISDDNGVFPESDLIERLKLWKRAPHNHPAAAIPHVPGTALRNLRPEIERLLQPFRRHSAAIRSIIAIGCQPVLGICEEAALLRLFVAEVISRWPSAWNHSGPLEIRLTASPNRRARYPVLAAGTICFSYRRTC